MSGFFVLHCLRKHATATRARLAVESMRDGIEVIIEDNGCGLLADLSASKTGFYGLRIMQERAQRFGGRVAFENLPKGGARVRVFIPGQASGAGTWSPMT